MRIKVGSLDRCSVINGGDRILVGVVDEDGRAVDISVTTDQAHSIAMTLPQVLAASLLRKHGDASLRYIVPLEAWKIEASSDGNRLIVTLASEDGFEFCFAAEMGTCSSLGSELSTSAEKLENVMTAVRN